MKRTLLISITALLLSGCSIPHPRYTIITTGNLPNVYCQEYVINNGVVSGIDIYGKPFVVGGSFYIRDEWAHPTIQCDK